MKILISNDDGFQAPGIVALHDALKDIADVEVVAPEHNNSAKSNALTLAAPLYVREAHNGFRYVTGTPADCVHIALKGLLDYRPDLGRRHAAEKVITQDSPRGETMYWIAGAGGAKDSGEGTDFHATAAGHIALTPLQIDLTDHANLGQWRETVTRLGN
jgi:broad specificity polyphosphatase/5'/3'-nucleotidase SurE